MYRFPCSKENPYYTTSLLLMGCSW